MIARVRSILKTGLSKFAGVACGGISRLESMLLGSPQLVQTEVFDAAQQTGGNRLIIGTGCVMMNTTPTGKYPVCV